MWQVRWATPCNGFIRRFGGRSLLFTLASMVAGISVTAKCMVTEYSSVG